MINLRICCLSRPVDADEATLNLKMACAVSLKNYDAVCENVSNLGYIIHKFCGACV
jgi:hypothetical protein